MTNNIFNDFFNIFYLIYGFLLFGSYMMIGLLSAFELNYYVKKNKFFNFNNIAQFKSLPSVSIIAPCYNEEMTLVENIRSLMLMNYPGIEIIIVNDGSKDRSLQKAIETYKLIKVDKSFEYKIPTAKIRGIYQSRLKAYANLTVIDKENGGKADALNAGINISQSDLFLAIDVDCIIEPDAVFRMVKPFLEEESGKKVIASGGVIRVANSCKIVNGQVVQVNYPTNLWARFQVLEYFRAFTLGRIAWSKINGLLIISGAFGLFDRNLVIKVGGYDKTTVGEDLELVVRMRKYMHLVEKKKYQVAFIPDPLCWTEVPTTIKILYRQRNRWTRGSIDTILKHRNMLFNKKFGRIGMVSFPYWVLFEWLAPIFEFVGLIYFMYMVSLGRIDIQFMILLMFLVFSFSMAFSSLAIFYEIRTYHRYKGLQFLLTVFSTSILEMIIFHPLNVLFAVSGNFDYFFRKKKKGWGNMTRTGFYQNDKLPPM
ncbi:MAG: glycosyltransferase family 2 protein [Paludibacteraceae bacterium]